MLFLSHGGSNPTGPQPVGVVAFRLLGSGFAGNGRNMTSSVQSISFVMHPERFWGLLIQWRLYLLTIRSFIHRGGFCHSLEGVILLAQEPRTNGV